jgi:hypothetical protein
MISTVTKPKNKQELLTQLQRKNPLKFSVIEYTDAKKRSEVLSVLDKVAKKGSVTVVLIEG